MKKLIKSHPVVTFICTAVLALVLIFVIVSFAVTGSAFGLLFGSGQSFTTPDGDKITYSFDSTGFESDSISDGTEYSLSAGEFIDIRFLPGTDIDSCKAGIINTYVDFTDIEFGGVCQIGTSGYYGERITGTDGSVTADAYLIEQNGGVLAIVVNYTSRTKDEQYQKLYGALNSFEPD